MGFVTMPLVLNKMPLAPFLGFIWFFLLFLAGITSSVSLAQPAVAFLEDEFDIHRKKSVSIFGLVSFLLCQPVIFWLGRGVVDELDFWGGTFFLVLFATIETILFAWVFGTSTTLSANGEPRRTIGMENAWDEIHKGADMAVPRVYKLIIKYVTPLFLFFILGMWFTQEWLPKIFMRNVSAGDRVFILGTRIGLLFILLILALLVKIAWKRKRLKKERIG